MSLTAEQIEWRAGHIGASEIPALFLGDYFISPADVYARIVHGATHKETPAMRAGNVFEDAILGWGVNEVGVGLDEKQAQYTSDFCSVVGATCDATVSTHERWGTRIKIAPMEAKFVSRYHPTHEQYGAIGTDDVPLPMRLQVMTQIACVESDVGYVVAYRDDKGFGWWKIERDDDLIAEIKRRAENLWHNHIEPKVPPSKSVASYDGLKSIARPEGKTTTLDPLLVAALAEARGKEKYAKAVARQMENKRKSLEARALQAMGDAQVGVTPGREVWVTRTPRSGYVVEDGETVAVEIRDSEMRDESEVAPVDGAIEKYEGSTHDD